MQTEILLTASESDTLKRLDAFVSEYADISRSHAAMLIAQKKIQVNGTIKVKSYKMAYGDNVTVEIPPKQEISLVPENIPLDIVFEDEHLLVVNKPKGLVVHPAVGHESGTLVNALMYHCGDSLSGINGEIRPGIVHRIDKDTSGLLVVAKHDKSHIGLSEQIKAHSFTRIYEAVVNGHVKENGTVDAPIARHKLDRKRMSVNLHDEGAREAVTHYEIITHYPNYTHLQLKLETGRTHQIRVHMAYIGYPVAGDTVYGNGKPTWLNGQCLHARRLGFIHPITGEYLEFDASLPSYFTKLLKNIDR